MWIFLPLAFEWTVEPPSADQCNHSGAPHNIKSSQLFLNDRLPNKISEDDNALVHISWTVCTHFVRVKWIVLRSLNGVAAVEFMNCFVRLRTLTNPISFHLFNYYTHWRMNVCSAADWLMHFDFNFHAKYANTNLRAHQLFNFAFIFHVLYITLLTRPNATRVRDLHFSGICLKFFDFIFTSHSNCHWYDALALWYLHKTTKSISHEWNPFHEKRIQKIVHFIWNCIRQH